MSANATAIVARQAGEIVRSGLPVGPRMEPCACGAGRHAHSGKMGIGKCEETGCKRYRPDRAWKMAYEAVDAAAKTIGDALREFDARERVKHYALAPRKPGEWSIGASDTATCPRKIQYRNRPPEDFEPAPEDTREARMGTIIHTEVTRQLKALYPWRLFDFKVRIPGLDRDSALDIYDPITGIVDDIKTAGDWRWDKLGDGGPEWSVWEQVLLYGLALEEAGYWVKGLRLSYIKRCNGHDEVFEMEYDRAAAERARERLLGYAEALDLGVELEKTGTGPSTDALCRRCFARNHCWNIPRAEELGRSPENVTILGEDPTEPEVIWAINERISTAATRLAAEKAEAEAKALVDGITEGRWGDDGEYEVYTQPIAPRANWKASYEKVLEYLDLPDGLRPKAEAVEPVKGRGSSTLKVGRTRKAVLEKERKERAALDKEAKAK